LNNNFKVCSCTGNGTACTCFGKQLIPTAPSPFNNPGLGQILIDGTNWPYPTDTVATRAITTTHIERIDQLEEHLGLIVTFLKHLEGAAIDKYIYKGTTNKISVNVSLETALARIWAELLNVKKEMKKLKEKQL
jgi:hypothetical protein